MRLDLIYKKMISNEGVLAINKALLKGPFLTTRAIKEKFNLVASTRTIRKYLKEIGWKKSRTRYCQVVDFVNRGFRLLVY